MDPLSVRVEWEDLSSYDVVLNLEFLGVPGACELVTRAAELEMFQPTEESRAAMEDMALASLVTAALARDPRTTHGQFRVGAKDGTVTVEGLVREQETADAVSDVVPAVDGVKALSNHVVKAGLLMRCASGRGVDSMEPQAHGLMAQPTRPATCRGGRAGALLAERALAERPSISIRLRIWLSMVAASSSLPVSCWHRWRSSPEWERSRSSSRRPARYALEIENARRFEKNYLLDGTNLDDAITRVQSAHLILRGSRDSLIGLVGPAAFERWKPI